MNKTNQFRSSEFFMAENDVLHLIFLDETGVEVNVELIGDEISADAAPGAVVAIDATSVTSSGFTANWNFTENANGYYFNLATDPDMTPHIGGYDNLNVGNVNHVHITGLTTGVTYYYQVSAYNDVGEGLESNIISTLVISTLPVVDLDGNSYSTVIIGNQEWTVENLKVTQYADTSAIPNITANGTASTFSDWFLPSRDELIAMQTELYANGVGGFSGSGYWSSSENSGGDPTQALYVYMSYGGGNSSKAIQYNVRACRAFTSVSPTYSLRDVGPAGGLIFWKNGNDYLEAAPSDQSVAQEWSNILTGIGASAQGTAIGTGQANTTAIVSQVGHTTSAAKLCDDLSIDVYNGWAGDTIGAYCWYDNDITNKATYGALYNWYAVNNGNGLVSFTRGGSPELGWRVPTVADMDALIATVGGLSMGGALKEVGLSHWYPPNTGAIDSYGFKALPSGVRELFNGTTFMFLDLTGYGYYYTQDDLPEPKSFGLYYGNENIFIWEVPKNHGLAVRCVRDISIGTVYVNFTDPLDTNVLWRKGVRSGQLRVDVTLTALGFSGVEGVDWENIKSI